MPAFQSFFETIIRIEGGYTNNPDDSGGPTNYGITQAVARQNGYSGDMRDIPIDIVKRIYKQRYWDVLRLDEIAVASSFVALKLADIAVNMGTYRAAEFMQRILNILNKQGTAYPDLKIDGNIGAITVSAFKSMMKLRGSAGTVVFVRALNCLQGEYYISLAERRQKDETFVFGWLQNRIT